MRSIWKLEIKNFDHYGIDFSSDTGCYEIVKFVNKDLICCINV